MPNKPAPTEARKRTKKPGKLADLPAKSLKAKNATAVKGGLSFKDGNITVGTTYHKMSSNTR